MNVMIIMNKVPSSYDLFELVQKLRDAVITNKRFEGVWIWKISWNTNECLLIK